MKAKVSLGLAKMPIPLKIEKARHIVTAITGNVSFPTPFPTLASITTAINALETAYNAAQGAGPAQTATMHDKEVIVNNLLSQLANYVEMTANGVEAVILSSGMGVKRPATHRPFTFTVRNGEHEGEVILQSEVTRNASYLWEISTDPLPTEPPAAPNASSWKPAGSSKQATFHINGLVARTKYWFRVATITSAGQGLWSDPVTIIVQ